MPGMPGPVKGALTPANTAEAASGWMCIVSPASIMEGSGSSTSGTAWRHLHAALLGKGKRVLGGTEEKTSHETNNKTLRTKQTKQYNNALGTFLVLSVIKPWLLVLLVGSWGPPGSWGLEILPKKIAFTPQKISVYEGFGFVSIKDWRVMLLILCNNISNSHHDTKPSRMGARRG